MNKHCTISGISLAFCCATLGAQAWADATDATPHKGIPVAATRPHAHLMRVADTHGTATQVASAGKAAEMDREALDANHMSAAGEGVFTPSSRLTPPN